MGFRDVSEWSSEWSSFPSVRPARGAVVCCGPETLQEGFDQLMWESRAGRTIEFAEGAPEEDACGDLELLALACELLDREL